MTPGFSANLGFLWTDRPLAGAIRAAARAGFDAVECHFPQEDEVPAIAAALAATGLPIVSLNTRPGDLAAGEFGLAALPGREAEARAAIADAVGIAARLGARFVHVMAGKTAEDAPARAVFVGNLRFAADLAAERGLGILIEPINRRDVPGYYLNRSDQAAELIEAAGRDNLRLMFDCYHARISEGDLSRRIASLLPLIAHVQIAAVPGRNEPDGGEVNYPELLAEIMRLGYRGLVGAEYRPRSTVEAGLGWLAAFRRGAG